MARTDLSWAIPVMRAGYAGRGLVYVVVAGMSLLSIWRGGQAQSTSSALGWIENTALGAALVGVILVGMLAYAVWRLVDAAYDLEAYGSGGKGVIARLGMVGTALVHLGIGLLAFSLLLGSGTGGGSAIPRHVDTLMGLPAGRGAVGLTGLAVVGAGLHYLNKGWRETYREHLQANRFTARWNVLLKAGVMSQGVVVGVIGLLFVHAAWRAAPDQTGGAGEAFSWLSQRAHGQLLVVLVCIGLLGFALFCFVNAAYRVVPKASSPGSRAVAGRLTS